jgi:hypothetical protein
VRNSQQRRYHFRQDLNIRQDYWVPTVSNQTKNQRPLTAKELRAVRKRRLEREKQSRKAQGIRSIWSLPTGQPVRRNYVITQLISLWLGPGIALRCLRDGLPLAGSIIIGGVVCALVTSFVAWSFRRNWPY